MSLDGTPPTREEALAALRALADASPLNEGEYCIHCDVTQYSWQKTLVHDVACPWYLAWEILKRDTACRQP